LIVQSNFGRLFPVTALSTLESSRPPNFQYSKPVSQQT
jgi:hypothetical protein